MDEDIAADNTIEAEPSNTSDPVFLGELDVHNIVTGDNSIQAQPSSPSDPVLLVELDEHNNDTGNNNNIEAQPSSPSDPVLLIEINEDDTGEINIEAEPSSRTDPALLAKMDEQMLRLNGFLRPVGIVCERLEIALERDRKALEREKLRKERERRADIAEQKRNARRDNNEESEERRDRKKRRRSGGGDKVRIDAVTPLKRNFNRIVQCCFCDLIVRPERFGGRESAFCSAECISRRVDLVRKCVKDSERILLIDLKGNIMNSSTNPTIETLEMYINQNPSYNPLIDDARLEAATQRDVDPAQQKKIDLMRMDVRKAIETSLQKRCKTANMNFSMKRYKDLGLDIERVLFANHQDVNVKYRKWFKTFMTVVNDEKNAYFKEVMRDKVSVKRLVTLNEEQMQVAIPVAVLAAADSTSSENANVISAASSSAFVRPVNVNKRPAVHGKSAVDEILGESTSDTTLLHTTHLFDANCEICKKDQAKKQAMRKRAEERESMLDAQVKRQQLQQGKPFFPNMDPSIMSAMIDTNMPAGGDPPSRHLRTGASDFDAPLSSLDPAIRAAMMDTNMPMPACGTSMLPPSRHHRTASRDFDPPLSSAVGGPTTPLDTGYDPEHDPLGLNTVQVGDPVMEENGNAVVEQQHRPDIDDDAAFGFGAGGAFDDDDFGGDEGGTFNNVGKGNVIQRQAFPPRRSSPTPAFSNCGFDGDGLQRHPPRRATPTPAFSNCGFGGGDDNRDTSRQFQQAHQQRASPPPNFSSNANLEPLGSVRRFPRFEKTTQEADTEQQHQQENSVFVAEPTTSFGSDEQQLQHRHLSPAAFVRSQRVALQQAAECTPHRTLYNESWKERGRQQQQQQRPHLLQDTEPPTEINETSPCFGEEADTDPWKTMSLLVWRGLFVWNRQTFFNCTCTAVSGGRAVFKAGREMVGDGGGGGDAGRIHLIGRSESRGVWEYVLQLRDSWNKQVCLMVINRPEDEHDFVTYVNCFERYNQGTQVGVLDFADHPTIKDGYVFTLSAGEALPAVLLPLDGVGLPEWTKHNGSIVLMLIRRMDHEDKQWKRRMGCDVSWRRVGTDAVEQQQPPLNIPLTPFASGAADDRMVRVLSDPRSTDCRFRRPDDGIDFAVKVEPTTMAALPSPMMMEMRSGIDDGGEDWRFDGMQRFDACSSSTPRLHRHSSRLLLPPMFAEISPIGPMTYSKPASTRHSSFYSDNFEEGGEQPYHHQHAVGRSSSNNIPATSHFRRPPSTARSAASSHCSTPTGAASAVASTSSIDLQPPLQIMPSASASVSAECMQPQQQLAENELPVVNTVDEVIEAIQRIDNPKEVIYFVSQFTRQRERTLKQADYERIQCAIRETAAVHRQRQQLRPPQQQQQRQRTEPLPAPEERQQKETEAENLISSDLTTEAANAVDNTQRPYSPSEWESLTPEAIAAVSATVASGTKIGEAVMKEDDAVTSGVVPSLSSSFADAKAADGSPQPPPPQNAELVGTSPQPPLPQSAEIAYGSLRPPPPPPQSAEIAYGSPHPPPPPPQSAEVALGSPQPPPPPPPQSVDVADCSHQPLAPQPQSAEITFSSLQPPPPPPPPPLFPQQSTENVGNFLHSPPPPPPPPSLMEATPLLLFPSTPSLPLGMATTTTAPMRFAFPPSSLPLRMASPMFLPPPPPPPQMSEVMLGDRGNQQHPLVAMDDRGNQQHPFMSMDHRGNRQHPLMAMGGHGNQQHPLMPMGGHGNQPHPLVMDDRGNRQHPLVAMDDRGTQQHPLMAMGGHGNQQHPLMAMGGHGNQHHPLMAMDDRGNQQHPLMAMDDRGNQQHPLMAMDDRGNQQHPLMAMDDRGNQQHSLMAMGGHGNQQHSSMMMGGRGDQPHPLIAMGGHGNQQHSSMMMGDRGNQPHPLMAMGGHGNQQHSSMMMGGRGNQPHSLMAMGGHGNQQHSSMMMGDRGNQPHPLMAMGGHGNQQHPLMAMGAHGNRQHSSLMMGGRGNRQHSSMMMGGRGNQQRW